MTGPTDPGDPDDGDWAFPEVAGPEPAGPASVDLPAIDEGQPHDTGSDAWWRAQAEAQRRAAENDPVVPPAAASNPLDRDWLPPDLTEPTVLLPPEALEPEPHIDLEPAPEPEPVYTAPEAPPTRPPHEPPRVGPARAVAGAALAIAGVALGIGALMWAGSDEPKGAPIVSSLATESSIPSPTPSPTPSATASPTAVPTAVVTTPVAQPPQAPIVPVSVLNNSRIKGLADRGAARFRAGVWPVPVTGNYRGGIIATTTVYFAPGQQASAQRFAKQFGIPRVAPRFAGLPTRGMTVVLTRDYH